jgi:hypothetical protein
MHVRHAEERIIAPAASIGTSAAEVLAEVLGGLAVGLETDEDAVADERPRHRLHAVIVEPDAADARVILARRDVELLGTVGSPDFQRADWHCNLQLVPNPEMS